MELIIYIYTYKLKQKEDAALVDKLIQCQSELIKSDNKSFVYLRKLVILRRELRYIKIEIFIYSMRMILLVSGLKLVGHKYLDPIFVSICGFMQAFTSVIKSMKNKKNFYKLEVEDLKQDHEETKQLLLTQAQVIKMNNERGFADQVKFMKAIDQFTNHENLKTSRENLSTLV